MVRTATVAARLRKPPVLKEYKDCVAEHRRLVSYLKTATNALPKAECELLSEFARISKRKCQRLRKTIDRQSLKNRSAA